MQLMSIAGGGTVSNSYTLTYLVVGGGGAGGTFATGAAATNVAGGGGGGGVVYSSVTVTAGTVFNIFVGAGGRGGTTSTVAGADGGSSVLTSAAVSVTAYGGGGGTTPNNSTAFLSSTATLLGSGGGGAGRGSVAGGVSSVGTSGTAGQGNAGGGGAGTAGTRSEAGGGGGGGAATAGTAGRVIGTAPSGGAGGAGTSISILTTSITVGAGGGGGGGGIASETAAAGGSGGGGTGGFVQTTNPSSQAGGNATYYGAGGGGAAATGNGAAAAGGSGSSGLVILSIPTANFSGTFAGADTSYTVGANTVVVYSAATSTAVGGSINLVAASTQYASRAYSANLNLATSTSWCVECWWRPATNATDNTLFTITGNVSSYAHARIEATPSQSFYALSSADGLNWLSITTGGTWAAGNWYHIAYVRNGSNFTLYVNGAVAVTYTSASNLFTPATTEINYVGLSPDLTQPTDGQITNVRVVRNSPVYTAAFTPPTAPLTAITNTQLLLGVTSSGTFLTDSGPNGLNFTATGATFSATTPFKSSATTKTYTA
jgi:hypothetical protein